MSLVLKTHIQHGSGDAEKALLQMFDQVPKLIKHEVAAKAVQAGAEVIVPRAQALTPRGNDSDRNKRSRKQKAEANWNIPLHTTIDSVVRKTKANAIAVVGPKWPEGNKAYFFTSPDGRKVVYWGRRTGQVRAQVRNWIVQATDETRAQQISAIGASLKQSMDKVWRT